jgi:hypothetical protein
MFVPAEGTIVEMGSRTLRTDTSFDSKRFGMGTVATAPNTLVLL